MSTTHPLTPAENAALDTEVHRHALRRIIGAGVTLVDAIEAATLAHTAHIKRDDAPGAATSDNAPEAARPTNPGPLPALAAALDRTARTIRRTIALAERLNKPAPATPARPTVSPEDRTAARKRIIREVEDAIERRRTRQHTDEGDADARALRAELNERLEDPELDIDLAIRPVAEIIADIVRDLGIAPGFTYKRRTPQDIQALNAQAARPNTS